MFRFIQKHKYFLVLLLALITLVVGFLFVVPTKETNEKTDAGTVTFTFKYTANWNNGDGELQTGKYISQDGHELNESVGTVSVSLTCSGGSWSGTTSIDTKNGSASCKYKFQNNNWFKAKDFSCSASVSASSKDGFYFYSVEPEYQSGIYGKLGAFNDYSESGSVTVVFAPKNYDITFDANGGAFGSDTTQEIETTYYESYNLPETNPTKVGYTFKGWFTEATGSDQVTSETCFEDSELTTLYAQWQANQYCLYFEKLGGAGGTSSASVIYDSQCINIEVPEREGYTFLGYFTSETGGTQYYDENGRALVVYTTDGDTTLYAHWQANDYKVSINTMNGQATELNGWTEENGLLNKIVTFDQNYGTLPILTQTGYTFECYCFGENIITAHTKMTTASEHTLLASWIEHAYSIKFEANGGSGVMADMTGIKFSQTQKLNKNSFTRDGFLFKGWATSSTGEVSFLDEEEVGGLSSVNNDVITLYALWEETWATQAVDPEGKGTESSPYLIANAQNLAWLANKNFGDSDFGGYYKQVANINLSERIWLSIGNENRKFIGNFDGNGYVITGLNTSQALNGKSEYLQSNVGLFGYISNATIKQINIMSGSLYGDDNTASVVGNAKNSIISACQTYAKINATGENVGGIVGRADSSKIENSYSQAGITAQTKFGGIVGFAKFSQIQACGFEGSLTGDGRLVLGEGYSSETIINDCFAYVANESAFCGGSATITNCLFTAGATKGYYEGSFSNWVISKIKEPLPSGLYWLATGGDKVTDISQIEALGYSKV